MVIGRLFLNVTLQVHLLPSLKLSDFVFEVFYGQIAEVEIGTQHSHVSIEVDRVETPNDCLLLKNTNMSQLFCRDSLGKLPSNTFNVHVVQVLQVGYVVGEVLQQGLANRVSFRLQLWHFGLMIISLWQLGSVIHLLRLTQRLY